MKPRPPLPPGPFLIVGLARSGVAAARTLRARGKEVIACDAGASPELREVAEGLSRLGVEVHLDASGDVIAARARTLIKSPGVPQSAPAIRAARDRGIPVLGELELAWRLLGNEFIAVTGTNGKTTTTEWIGQIHREAALPVAVAGNVGTALASLVDSPALPDGATIICESSSFQLEDTEAFAPEAAVLLNISPDHLDRHGTFDAYVAAKLKVFANQGNDDIAVAPTDLKVEDLGGCARRVCFGFGAGAELSLRERHLWWDERALIAAGEISLPGEHNLQNAMAAAAVCLARGIDPEAVIAGLKSFRGVAHRLELIAEHDGVAYVNDSKATNVDSTLMALRAYERPIHLILGGVGKSQDYTPLAGPIGERCRAVYLIGEATEEIAVAIGAGIGTTPMNRCGDLPAALAAAHGAATPGEVVLLSPASASFDQYANFEARGEHFRTLVEAL